MSLIIEYLWILNIISSKMHILSAMPQIIVHGGKLLLTKQALSLTQSNEGEKSSYKLTQVSDNSSETNFKGRKFN